MRNLILLSPDADISEMYASKAIERMFGEVKEENDARTGRTGRRKWLWIGGRNGRGRRPGRLVRVLELGGCPCSHRGAGKTMIGSWKIATLRRRPGATAALFAFAAAFAMIPSGCLGPDPDRGSYLRFQNPELTAGLDSLRILGVNAHKGDTLLIQRWVTGKDFPAASPLSAGFGSDLYPPGARIPRGNPGVPESHRDRRWQSPGASARDAHGGPEPTRHAHIPYGSGRGFDRNDARLGNAARYLPAGGQQRIGGVYAGSRLRMVPAGGNLSVAKACLAWEPWPWKIPGPIASWPKTRQGKIRWISN